MTPVAPKLQTEYTTIDLPYRPLPPQSELEALAKSSGYRARWAKRMLALAASRAASTILPLSGSSLELGGNQWTRWAAKWWSTMPDAESPLRGTDLIAGYANDVMAYIPSRRVWEEGGASKRLEVYGMPAQVGQRRGGTHPPLRRSVVKQPAQ